MKILVVDDNQDSRMILRKNLEEAGYEVKEAIHGADALEKARASIPDLIISDILMPVMDGYKLCFEVKHDKKLNTIPFVFYTATYTDLEDERLAISLGASRYILKPVEMDDFLQTIIEVVREAREGQLLVPDEPIEDPAELFRMYDASLANKLQDKISELEKAKNKTEESERCFQSLFSSMRDVIVMADLERRVVNVNQPAMRDMFGYELDEIAGRNTRLFYADEQEYEDAGRKFFLKKEPVEGLLFETRFKRKNGEIFSGELTAIKLLDEQGKVRGNVGIIRDITERKKSEEEIRKARDNWQRTFDAIPDVVTMQDDNYKILQVNKAAGRLLGGSPENFIGRQCYEIFSCAAETCSGCPVKKALTDLKPHSAEIEYPKLKRVFSVTAAPIVVESGKVRGIAHIAKDIIDQKKLEGQLRQAQKMEAIGTLAGGIAHDFNNILTALIGFTELARMEVPAGNGKAQADLEEVMKASVRARELVKQILTFSRQREEERMPLRMQYIVKEALKLLRSSLPTTIEIREDIDEDCGTVLADPTQIHQVVMNLCTNAYHAMRDKGGLLGVTLKPTEIGEGYAESFLDLTAGRYLKMEISDTGCGMDQETVEKIFEPYFTTKKKGEGTGLGLAVVHGIVVSHGGHISVYSEPDRGTTFKLYFPLHEGSEPAGDIGLKKEEDMPRGSEKILLVDDEEVIVNVEKRTLENLGYQVTTAIDSSDALRLFARQPAAFDLVITDMTMPEMTGLDLAREILAIRPGIPIILCTGFSEIVNEKSAKAVGIKEFIMKPIERSEMANLIRKALQAGPE